MAGLQPLQGSGPEIAATLNLATVVAISAICLHGARGSTRSVGCFIVMPMKGRANVAGAFKIGRCPSSG